MSTEGMEESIAGFDPWGMKRIEKLLVELDGVGSIKIVPDGQGGIDEIHVLSASSLGPKRIVRNIESALLAEFGLQIDHRKISVARTRQADIVAAPEEESGSTAEGEFVSAASGTALAASRRTVLKNVHMERMAGKEFSCRVELIHGEEEFIGEAEGPDFERSRIEVAAAAVLEALLKTVDEGVHLAIQGVSELESLDSKFVVVVVGVSIGRRSETLSGIESISDSAEEAAVFACLKATNRWLEGR